MSGRTKGRANTSPLVPELYEGFSRVVEYWYTDPQGGRKIAIYSMAAKKKAKSAFGAKAAFVRGLPRDTPAKEAVAMAAKKGLKLSENYVYTIRSSSGSAKGTKGKPGLKPGRRASASNGMTPAEAQLRAAIADLGLVRATEILEGVKATIRGR